MLKLLKNEPLARHTTFKIGGKAKYFICPREIKELKEALVFAGKKKLPLLIIGAGSNILVKDKGFSGLVIKLLGGLKKYNIKQNIVTAQAGVYLPELALICAKRSLSGLEFLSGIPGTVGGAVKGNAGAWGQEIAQIVKSVTVITLKGKLKKLKPAQITFGYRKSNLKDIVIEVELKLEKSTKEKIYQKIREYILKRKLSQPLEYPSAGSVFKNPRGYHVAKLIESCGLKGKRIGQAQISKKHANFIVNLARAKAKEVIALMNLIKKKVEKKFKITLEPELKIV